MSNLCYFKSIELQNIKSFGRTNQTLEFTLASGALSQWTLLLGDNGVGKTTILQCLAESCADHASPFPPIPKNKDGKTQSHAPRFLRYAATHPMPYGRIDSKSSSVKVHFTSAVALGENLGKPDADPRSTVSFHLNKGQFASGLLVNDKFASVQPCGYGAFRRFGPTKLGADLNPDACATLFNDDEPLLNVEEWLLRSDYAATKSKDERAEKRRDKIISLLVRFLPEVYDIRIQASGSEVPTPEAKTPDGWVPVRSLSTGYKATMAWVTDFAARMLDRYPESRSPFSEPAIVLVDQIDTHLHPKWQRQLIRDLSKSFPSTQFIVTAHSPLMVLAMPQANICVLRRDGDHTVICNHPNDVRGWRLDQILASDLFEEQPTRDTETQAKLEERRLLLTKNHRTKEEQTRLRYLNKWATSIPTADTPEDIRAMEIIRKASEKISD